MQKTYFVPEKNFKITKYLSEILILVQTIDFCCQY